MGIRMNPLKLSGFNLERDWFILCGKIAQTCAKEYYVQHSFWYLWLQFLLYLLITLEKLSTQLEIQFLILS